MFEFELLSGEDKVRYVEATGKFLASREFGQFCIFLYTVHNFFAEIWLHTELDTLYAVTAFRDPNRLDAYVKEVSLKALFE